MNATEEFFIVLCVIIIVSVVIWYFKIYKKPTEIVKSPLETLLSVDFKDSQHILNPVNGTVETYVLEYATPQNLGKYVDLQIEWKNGLGFTNAGVTGFVLKRKIVDPEDSSEYKYINVSKDQTKLTKNGSKLVSGEIYNITDNTQCIFIIKGEFIQDEVNVVGANIIEVFAIVPGNEIQVGSTTIFINQKEHLDPVLTITEVMRVRYVPILGGEKESLGENTTYTIESGNKKCEVDFNTDYQGVAKIDVDEELHEINLFKYNETQFVIRNAVDNYLICEDTGSKPILRIVSYEYLNNKIREYNITDFGFMTFTYTVKGIIESVTPTPASASAPAPAFSFEPAPAPSKLPCSAKSNDKDACESDGKCGFFQWWNFDGSSTDFCYDKPCDLRSATYEACTGKCKISSICDSGSLVGFECVDEGKRKPITYCPPPPPPVHCKTSPTPDRDVPTYITHCFGGLDNRAIGGIVTNPKLNTVLLTPYKITVDIPAANGGNPCVGVNGKYWDTKFTESAYDPVCTKVSCPPCSELKKTLPQVRKIDNALSFSADLVYQIQKSANIPFFKEAEYAKLSEHPDLLGAYKDYLATGKYKLPSPSSPSPSLVTPGVVLDAVSSSGWATFPTYLNAFSPASNELANTVTKSGGFDWKGIFKGIR